MPRRIALGLALLCFHPAISLALAPDARWTRLVSANFEMYLDADEALARDTLSLFEHVRSFFLQSMPGAQAASTRTRIVGFSSFKDYEPYRTNELAVTHSVAKPDFDCIVMGQVGADAFPSAIHEYVHLLARDSGLKFPLWLSEGIAELYSNLKPAGENVLVGSIIESRRRRLLEDRPVPLQLILAAGYDSSYYNAKDQSGSFYNEAWALTHMLALTPEYGPKFSQVLLAVSNGTPSVGALEQAYGKPLSKIELDWQAYVRSETFQAVRIPAKREATAGKANVEAADEFDIALVLSKIGDRPGNEIATRTALSNLIQRNPKRFEPYEDLAYFELRQGQTDRALESFAKVYELESRNPRVLWSYGKLLESKDPRKSIELFRDLIALAPERLDARLELASLQFQLHERQAALDTLEPVTKVANEDAPRLLTLLARLNLEAGNREKARNAAEQLKKVSVFAADRERADELLQIIDSQPSQLATVVTIGQDQDAPVLKHRDAVEEEPAIPRRDSDPKRPTFAGAFVELLCGEQVRIVMGTAEGKRILLIDDPRKLSVNGENGAILDLSCGLQNKIRIRIEYEAPGEKTRGIDGVARVIHIEP